MHSINNPSEESNRYSWCVAVFAARETPLQLLATINAIVHAAHEPTVIDVMVNGNSSLAREFAALVKTTGQLPVIRIWLVALGGKAHAWNQYVHLVWPGAMNTFFVDGYASIHPNALELLATGMSSSPHSIAATALPTSGASASTLREQMTRHGGLTGALFALKESTMGELRTRDIRLPLGLYGFDTLLGAVLGFGLDPAKNEWNPQKYILVHPEVTFTIPTKKWWRYSDVKTQLNRILNNALRVLVIQATKNFLAYRKLPPEHLPRTIEDFILGWMQMDPPGASRTLWKSPLCWVALNKLRHPKDWSAAELPPNMLYASRPLV